MRNPDQNQRCRHAFLSQSCWNIHYESLQPAKVKVNPIGDITQTYFCQGTISLVSWQTLVVYSISDLSAVCGLTWHPPVWRQGRRSPQQRDVCSAQGLQRRRWPCRIAWNIDDVQGSTAVKLVCCKTQEKKQKLNVCHKISGLDLLHSLYDSTSCSIMSQTKHCKNQIEI